MQSGPNAMNSRSATGAAVALADSESFSSMAETEGLALLYLRPQLLCMYAFHVVQRSGCPVPPGARSRVSVHEQGELAESTRHLHHGHGSPSQSALGLAPKPPNARSTLGCFIDTPVRISPSVKRRERTAGTRCSRRARPVHHFWEQIDLGHQAAEPHGTPWAHLAQYGTPVTEQRPYVDAAPRPPPPPARIPPLGLAASRHLGV
ncbi:hypothetical protein Q5P01_000776 [Channa striata]|uniref:Uncharacterized protein n=1 Tax=Channa striata TaxID=64152 RepID=A0AA88LIT5_CHASR|nr:hypothetical protein Q5P01_000776 [Channa striata]